MPTELHSFKKQQVNKPNRPFLPCRANGFHDSDLALFAVAGAELRGDKL